MLELFTIGHSVHPVEHFVELLKRHGITALCDVRSSPYSRFTPQFNRETLKEEVAKTSHRLPLPGRGTGSAKRRSDLL